MANPIGDFEITQAMQFYGGSFVRTLGELAQRADADNLQRLKAAFPEYWAEYAEMARTRRERAAGAGVQS